MNDSRLKLGVLLIVLGLPVSTAFPASPTKFSGSLTGIVQDGGGVPQMGAVVLLFNRYDRLIQRATTNSMGTFGFDALLPDVYSVRVNLASFVTAVKQSIAVEAGMRSVLRIHLASVLSTIELTYSAPGVMMSDDWKWILRTSMATRPVLRLMPNPNISDPTHNTRIATSIFSDTRGMLKVSAGDPGSFAASNNASDLGTAFALATSLFGDNQVQLSGNVGYTSHAGIPAAGFRTTYSRTGEGMVTPEVTLTVRQLYLPGLVGASLISGQQPGLPALRTMSLSFLDHLDIADNLHLEYGAAMDSVSFLDRLNYLSPFARATYNLGSFGSLQGAFISGAAPVELFTRTGGEAETELHEELTALASLPRISLRGGHARVQRTENFEAGFHKVAGSRDYSVGVYRESVSNGALMVAGGTDLLPSGDVLPDISSRSTIFNIGSYNRVGLTVSMTQSFGQSVELTGAFGNSGVLNTEGPQAAARAVSSESGNDLRSLLHSGRRNWASVKAAATMPASGTKLSASYQWMDYATLMPTHVYLTQKMSPEAGLNIYVRQPLPAFGLLPGRLEASAEMRNLLAEGYLPIRASDSRRLVLIQSPRAVRGGLSFIF